jgi:uncharacterized pyridoxamine 5'-phosphate oxidase family protein
MSDFFNNKKDNNFFDGFSLKPKVYTICIVFLDGNSIEQTCIENPWAYMKELKKNPKIKTCFIKD